MQVSCPSGLKVIARPWVIGDHAALLNTKELRGTSLPKRMLELAVQEVVEPGPYPFKTGGAVDGDILSLADITVGNVLVRLGTGAPLLVAPTCVACRRPLVDPVEVDLASMPIFMASEEGIAHLASGVPVSRTYRDGVQVALKAVRGKDLVSIGALQEQQPEHVMEVQLCCYIAEIRHASLPTPLLNLPDIQGFVRSRDWGLRDSIQDDIDDLWGGADTTHTFSCDRPTCLTQQDDILPLDLTFYGLNQSGRRSRRQKRSSARRSAGELMQSSFSPSSSDLPKRQPST